MNKTKPSRTFEASLERLNAIIDALDADDTSLEASVALYEEGIELLDRCASELRSAERKVTELRRRADGIFERIDVQTSDPDS